MSRSFAPVGYQRQLQAQPAIPTYEQPQTYNPVQYYSVPNSPVTSYQDPTELNRNRRHDTNEDDGGRRLLSTSAINRITETLGALNTVGRYLVNMTRGEEGAKVKDTNEQIQEEEPLEEDEEEENNSSGLGWFDDDDDDEEEDDDDDDYSDESDEDIKKKKQRVTTKKPLTTGSTTTVKSSGIEESNDNVPEALLTLTSNMLGKNLTKTIEPLFKRVTQGPSDAAAPSSKEDEVVEIDGKKSKTKNKTNKKKKRENPKTKIAIASSTSTTRRPTATTSATTIKPTTAKPQLSFLESIPSVVPTPTGRCRRTCKVGISRLKM